MNITIPKRLEKNLALPSAKTLLKGIAVIALSRAEIFGMSPLAIAFAASFSPGDGYIALLGLAAGMADSGLLCLKYIFSYLIYYMLSYIRKNASIKIKAYFLGLSVAAAGAVGLMLGGGSILSAITLVSEAVICAGLYLLFNNIGRKTPAAQLAEIIILGGIICGFSGVTLPYINVNAAVFASIFAAMSICYACRTETAVFVCAALGFSITAAGDNAVTACGAYALSAVLGSLMAGMGRFAMTVGFLCGITVSALYQGSLSGMNMGDIFAPMLFFVLIPEKVHYKIGSFINNRFSADFAEDEREAQLAMKLRTVAAAFSGLGYGIGTGGGYNENTKAIYDMVSGRVCRECSLFGSCWETGREKTCENMYEIWCAMERDGFCDSTNMPARFRQSCIKSESLLCEFRHAYELAKQSALLSGEAGADRSIMARQYGEISNVLENLSREFETGFDAQTEEETIRVKVTVMNEPKPGNSSCGDSVVHFKKDGRYFVILCDGMGSGEEAKSQSRLAARLFEEFLKAGFEKESAVNIINAALALKADRESFSTADILEIDLSGGTAEFLKIGSAQSIIKSKKEIEVISSKSLPVGILEEVDAEPQRRCIFPGDVILMMSDGVGEAGTGIMKNEWLKKVLMLENRGDEELGRLILSGAKSRTRFCDDMTCCIIRIKKER